MKRQRLSDTYVVAFRARSPHDLAALINDHEDPDTDCVDIAFTVDPDPEAEYPYAAFMILAL
jgi:hypothetical protein